MPSTGRPGYFVDIFVDMSMIITSRPVGEGQGWVPGLWCQLGAVQRSDGRVRVTKFNVMSYLCQVSRYAALRDEISHIRQTVQLNLFGLSCQVRCRQQQHCHGHHKCPVSGTEHGDVHQDREPQTWPHQVPGRSLWLNSVMHSTKHCITKYVWH